MCHQTFYLLLFREPGIPIGKLRNFLVTVKEQDKPLSPPDGEIFSVHFPKDRFVSQARSLHGGMSNDTCETHKKSFSPLTAHLLLVF